MKEHLSKTYHSPYTCYFTLSDPGTSFLLSTLFARLLSPGFRNRDGVTLFTQGSPGSEDNYRFRQPGLSTGGTVSNSATNLEALPTSRSTVRLPN